MSEEQYFLDLILSSRAGYDQSLDNSNNKLGTFGDRIKSAEAIVEVVWHYRDNHSYLIPVFVEALSQFTERGETMSQQGEQTLCDLACDDSAFIDLREAAVETITDPAMKSKAKAAVEAYLEVHPKKSQAEIDLENALIAADSGLGRTG